ncbi:MAG: hypothetical protein C4519_10160 [Desulfobacteraceae bacterium]|nr:MAG: hypothetical protein C4519_10160 [Desulfobacteraceae bacterium]
MLIHDGLFAWEGFGGVYQLAAGKCRLRILDLSRGGQGKVAHMKSILVVVSDIPADHPQFRKVSVRSCAGHIATTVTKKFGIDPQRMIYVEYYPPTTYGDRNQHVIEAKYDLVDFTWFEDKAMHPKWRPLPSPLRAVLARTISGGQVSEPSNR